MPFDWYNGLNNLIIITQYPGCVMVRPPGAGAAAPGPDRTDRLHLPHSLHQRGEIHNRGTPIL